MYFCRTTTCISNPENKISFDSSLEVVENFIDSKKAIMYENISLIKHLKVWENMKSIFCWKRIRA